MAQRTRRPAPRTLSAAPLPMLRAPASTVYQARFPSLVAVVAGGMFLPACEGPRCGETRADELKSHGERGANNLREGRAAEAIREIGIATGIVAHGSTSVPEPQVAGAAPAVYPAPTVVPPPPAQQVIPQSMEGQGLQVGPAPVAPPATHPPTAVTPHRVPARGGVRRITPVAPPTPPPTPPVRHGGALRGDVARVGPSAANLTTTRLRQT